MGCGASNKVQELDTEQLNENDEDDPLMRKKSLKCPKCGKNYLIPQMMINQVNEDTWCRKCIQMQAEIQNGHFNPNMGNGFTPSWYDTGQSNYVAKPYEPLPDLTIKLTYTKLEDTYDEKKKRQALKRQKESESRIKTPKLVDKRNVLKKVNKAVHSSRAEQEDTPQTPKKQPLTQRRQSTIPLFFKMLTNGTFMVIDNQPLTERPITFSVIQGRILLTHENSISAWSLDFELLGKLKMERMKEIQALAELKSGRIAVACGNGLHIITKVGFYEGRIEDGMFTDVKGVQETLYAAEFGGAGKATIQVYDEAMPWVLIRTITLPVDGFVTFSVNEDTLTVCSSSFAALYITTLNGDLLQKCACKGVHGRLGQFRDPRLCQNAEDGSILVTDIENDGMQVRTRGGEWGKVQLENKVKRPGCALFYKKQLIVLQTAEPYTMFKYS